MRWCKMAKSKGAAAGAKIYPAPSPAMTVWSHRALFFKADAAPIVARVKLPIAKSQEAALIEALNEAALEYFRAARQALQGTPSAFEEWTARLANASAAFLHALGLQTDGPLPPGGFPLPAYTALCSRQGKMLTDRPYPRGFNYMGTLESAARGALVAHDLASHAAGYYAARKKPREVAAKRGLSPRQVFVLHLGRTFEACFDERVPGNPNIAGSPFLRFTIAACQLVAARMVPPKPQVTSPQDGSDYEAAKLLAGDQHILGAKIADDVRKRVFARINRTRAAPEISDAPPNKIAGNAPR